MAYNQLEEPLKLIHKKFVSLDEGEVNMAKLVVKKVLSNLVNYMKEEDTLFQDLYDGLYFGGSFYHNLKIQHPDEFDIDVTLRVPECERCKANNCACVEISPGPVPGFLRFKITKSFCPTLYKRCCKAGFVQSNLVYNWMKSLIYKALNRYALDRHGAGRAVSSFDDVLKNTEVKLYTECAPALKICIKYESRLTYVDLAAAFMLHQKRWPSARAGYRVNPTKAEFFSIVPSSPKGAFNYWRPSFQEQEKEIISKKERLKPALRLLKMMKINLNHKVSSYILKTLILEEADNYEWKNMSLAHTFMLLMQKYTDCLRQGRLQYYWNDRVNLLDYIKDRTLLNHYNEVHKLYLKIQREYETKPSVVAEVILKSHSDCDQFHKDWENNQARILNCGTTVLCSRKKPMLTISRILTSSIQECLQATKKLGIN